MANKLAVCQRDKEGFDLLRPLMTGRDNAAWEWEREGGRGRTETEALSNPQDTLYDIKSLKLLFVSFISCHKYR